MLSDSLEKTDPQIARIIAEELDRQRNTLELIASENIVSKPVMTVQGSILTNKYAEGYPGKRYYGGCEHVDVAENLATERARQLFSSDYANVQPHSGSQANMAVLFAFLNHGDNILAMDLAHGGHLTHGAKVSFSGKFFNAYHYGVNADTGTIDYEEVSRLAQKHKPRMIIAGASSYPRFIDFKAFAQIAKSQNAYLMVDMAHIAGLVATGVHPSPVPFADIVTSTTHKTLRGPRGGLILSKQDYAGRLNKEIFPGIQGGPLMHVIAAKAVAFKEAASESFKTYQENVVKNAKTLANALMDRGLNLVSNGTDNHLILVDLSNLKITGKHAEHVLGKAGITANKNKVPFDKQSPAVTGGIRFGTPTLTSRGMKTREMKEIAKMIVDVIENPENNSLIKSTRQKVIDICDCFPIYSDLRNDQFCS